MPAKMDSDKFYRIDHPLLHDLILHDGKICPAPHSGHINGRNIGRRQAVEGKLYIPRSSSIELPSEWWDKIEIWGLIAHLPDGTLVPIYERGTPRPSDEATQQQMALEIGALYEAKRSELIQSVVATMGESKGPEAETILDNILHNLTTEWSQNDIRRQFSGFLYALLALKLINPKQQGELLHGFNEVCDTGIKLRGYLQELRR